MLRDNARRRSRPARELPPTTGRRAVGTRPGTATNGLRMMNRARASRPNQGLHPIPKAEASRRAPVQELRLAPRRRPERTAKRPRPELKTRMRTTRVRRMRAMQTRARQVTRRKARGRATRAREATRGPANGHRRVRRASPRGRRPIEVNRTRRTVLLRVPRALPRPGTSVHSPRTPARTRRPKAARRRPPRGRQARPPRPARKGPKDPRKVTHPWGTRPVRVRQKRSPTAQKKRRMAMPRRGRGERTTQESRVRVVRRAVLVLAPKQATGKRLRETWPIPKGKRAGANLLRVRRAARVRKLRPPRVRSRRKRPPHRTGTMRERSVWETRPDLLVAAGREGERKAKRWMRQRRRRMKPIWSMRTRRPRWRWST